MRAKSSCLKVINGKNFTCSNRAEVVRWLTSCLSAARAAWRRIFVGLTFAKRAYVILTYQPPISKTKWLLTVEPSASLE